MKTVVKAIATVTEEAKFQAAPEGISSRSMDPSHVALIDLMWPSSGFDKYECEKETVFVVKSDDLLKLLARADGKDNVELAASGTDVLTLRFANGYHREFNLHLIENTTGPTPLPKLQFDMRLLMTYGAFQKVLGDVSTVSDHIQVEALKDKVTFSGKSESGSASAQLEKANPELLEYEVKQESKALYSIEYLANLIKAISGGTPTVGLELSNKMPLKLNIKLGSTEGKEGSNPERATLQFYLAPRIEER